MMSESDQALCASLHDADLVRFSSDVSARTATFEVNVEHLGDESGAGATFSIVLHVVRAIVFKQWHPWSPADRALPNAERPEPSDWGQMQSVDVFDFTGPCLRVHAASLRTSSSSDLWPVVSDFPKGPAQVLALDIDGTGSPIENLAISIAFERIELARGGQSITVAEFVALGDAYWEQWAAQNKSGTETAPLPPPNEPRR